MKPAKNGMQKSSRSATASGKNEGFTDEERAAMRKRADELKTAAHRGARGFWCK
jgi:hypothetical protein